MLTLLFAGLQAGAPALRAQSDAVPKPLVDVRFEQRLGEFVPLDLPFLDEKGREVTIGDYLGDRPAVLALVYYRCPMLCTLILNGLTQSLKTLTFNPGKEFEVVVVSFDPRETPDLAAEAKSEHLKRYGRSDTEDGWHFLTGTEASIRELTGSVGFHYAYDPEQGEFAHAAGIVVLTPQGKLARYFYGIEYPPRDLRLGLVEATDETIGSLVDQVLLYCFRYDPTTGRYTAVVMNIVRLGALATLLVMGIFLTAAWRIERRLATAEKTR